MPDRTSSKPRKKQKASAKTPRRPSRQTSRSVIAAPGKHFLSDKVGHFTESVIREMTRQAMLYGAVNLAQGFPDFPAPAEIKQAAQQAVADDVNQYAITWARRICATQSLVRWEYGNELQSIPKKKSQSAADRPRP